MKVQTINILTNNSMAKNIKNDSEEDENNIETNQVGFLKILPQSLSQKSSYLCKLISGRC